MTRSHDSLSLRFTSHDCTLIRRHINIIMRVWGVCRQATLAPTSRTRAAIACACVRHVMKHDHDATRGHLTGHLPFIALSERAGAADPRAGERGRRAGEVTELDSSGARKLSDGVDHASNHVMRERQPGSHRLAWTFRRMERLIVMKTSATGGSAGVDRGHGNVC